MKKGKFSQHVFITSGKLKLQINLQIFVACTGTYAKNIGQRIFSRTSKFRVVVTISQEIDKKSNRKPKRLPMIQVTYALLTILVSYK